jgi:hypothetical protein
VWSRDGFREEKFGQRISENGGGCVAKRSLSDPQTGSGPGDVCDKELAEVKVGPAGASLRWERLDTDLSVATLASAALGATVLLRAAGSLGGCARTRAKKRAAHLNGMKGGRPRKTAA